MLNNLRTSLQTLQIRNNHNNNTDQTIDNKKKDDDTNSDSSNNSAITITSSSSSNNNNDKNKDNNSNQHQPTTTTMIQRIRDRVVNNIENHNKEDEKVKYVKVLYPTTDEIYEGPVIKGSIRHGDGGINTWPDGMKFLGTFENDAPTNGTLITAAYTYTGTLLDMKFHGSSGVLCSSDGSTYEGEFSHGEYHGCGKYKSSNGSIYTGNFLHGIMEGIGNIIESDGKSTYSGSWKRGTKDGEGHEILLNGEEYNGQFHRNKRNGNGCLTTHDGTKIEGIFKAGKVVNGISLEIIYPDGRKYSGEAVSCEPHGVGTMKYFDACHANDATVYNGEFSHGMRHGKGHCCYANGDLFDGYWEKNDPVKMNMENMESLENNQNSSIVDDKEGMTVPTTSNENHNNNKPTTEVDIDDDGESIAAMSHLTDPTIVSATTLDMSCHASTSSSAFHTYPNGDTYHGRVDRRRQCQGYGKYIASTYTYEGMFKNSNKHGKGEYVTAYAKYDGEFYNDEMHGTGTLVYNDSSSYTGNFKEGVYHGKGMLTEEDGRVYKGLFLNGLRNGHGTESFPETNTYYDGEYKNGKREDFGTLFSEIDQSIIYAGLWKNDVYDGEGVVFYNNHESYLKFEGNFLQGTQSGSGMLTLKDESILIGKWIRNNPIDGLWQITYPCTSLLTTYSGSASFFPPDMMPLPQGEGTMNYVNGDVYAGNFIKDKRSGKGTCNYSNGDVWDGEFCNDELDYNCIGVLTLADGTIERFDGNGACENA